MMWDCGFPLFSPWMGGITFWGLGAILLLAALLGFFLFGSRRANKTRIADREDSLGIINMRLARGELSQEDYQEIKKILEQA